MIQLTPHMRCYLAVEPADFRCGIDGLARLCRQKLDADPFSGAVFVFGNRRKTAVKILVYDGQGFWLCQKRLSKGTFSFWPGRERGRVQELEPHAVQILLYGGDFEAASVLPPWRPVHPAA